MSAISGRAFRSTKILRAALASACLAWAAATEVAAQSFIVVSATVKIRGEATSHVPFLPGGPVQDVCDIQQFSPFQAARLGKDLAAVCTQEALHGQRPIPYCSAWLNSAVLLEGSGRRELEIVWANNATTVCDADLYTASSSQVLDTTLTLGLAGVPVGTVVRVFYVWDQFSQVFTEHEAVLGPGEDPVSAGPNLLEINGVEQLAGRFDFADPPGLSGWNRLQNQGGFIDLRAGLDTVTIRVASGANARIDLPPRPNGRPADASNSNFYGSIRFGAGALPTLTPPDGTGSYVEFSPDIGSDSELSDPLRDGDERFDPGDAYRWIGPALPPGGTDGIRDDARLAGADPDPAAPDGPPPITGAPVGSGQGTAASLDFFDLDGHEVVATRLVPGTFGPGLPSVPRSADRCIHPPDHLLISYDDDPAGHYALPPGEAPAAAPSPFQGTRYGTAARRNEVIGLELGPVVPAAVLFEYPVTDEPGLHVSLGPGPDLAEALDDDTDALDVLPDPPEECNVWYFSADHEAAAVNPVTGVGLDPGAIYLSPPGGGFTPIIDPRVHLGLQPGADVDGFELTWLPDPVAGRDGLAVLFSVADDDPATSGPVSLTFSRADHAAGSTPEGVAAADLDGDGDLDLAVTSASPSAVRLLTNRGDGVFQAAATVPVPGPPGCLVAGDLDGDGDTDLAVCGGGPVGRVTILRNNGTGGFTGSTTYSTGAGGPFDLAMGDLDGDGDFDLAVANGNPPSNNVAVLRNRGDGTLDLPQTFAARGNPSALALGDFDFDRDLDLFVINVLTDSLTVLLNDGAGSFTATPTAYPVGLGGQTLTALAVGDLNRDGSPDAVVSSGNGGSLSILLHDGLANFLSPRTLPGGSFPADLALADHDGDGDLDLAVPSANAPYQITIFRNDGSGGLAPARTIPLDSGPSSVAAADLTGEGVDDLAVTMAGPGEVAVLLNRSDLHDETGGLDPRMIYASFLDGRHFPLLQDPLADDVDAITAWETAFVDARPAPAPCVAGAERLCLNGGRFKVEVTWRDFSGNTGSGHALPLTGDTGYFWFFDPANVELVIKVLDGRPLNNRFWVFYGALSSVEYTVVVTDTATGVRKVYSNASGQLASVADTGAFTGPAVFRGASPELTPGASRADEIGVAAPESTCAASSTALCLNGGRFRVEATWRDFSGNAGVGTAVSLTGDTGYFWFFSSDNVELILKVLDGRPVNGRFWVFYGALSSVEYTIRVTDTMTGAVKTYTNPAGRLASVADTSAF